MDKDEAIALGKRQECLCETCRIIVRRGLTYNLISAKLARLYTLRKKYSILSFRAKRGISLRFKHKKIKKRSLQTDSHSEWKTDAPVQLDPIELYFL